ncbi:MAG TPA: TRAP transporter permease, partial [Desulfobacteraceae bacterium]|nr:TRAP transporter permease [Desulfobacteraceae bacterium]
MYDKLNKAEKILFDVLAVSLVLFYSYAAVVSPASTQYHRGIYVIITYVLVFLAYKSQSKKWPGLNPALRVTDYLLILLSIFTIGYWILNFEDINYRTGAETPFDMAVAMIGVLIGIELARRVVGNIFVVIGVLAL